MDLRQAIATVRFGLGRRADEPVPGDPVAWLDGQVGRVAPLRPAPGLPEPPPLGTLHALLFERNVQSRNDREVGREIVRGTDAWALAWTSHCLLSDRSYQDRLTNLWMNHLTVSRRVRNAGLYLGPYLQDVVRANQFGKFEDMLLAMARHPAMLVYLQNQRSIGPRSTLGQRSGRGLNENLAREILELHTVTPAAGYSQRDVTEFARILTGWGIERDASQGGYHFRAAAHEPGPKTLMGRTFPEGEQGGVDALRFLARHPATQRNLATRMVRHFVADDPPKPAVDAIFAVLRDTQGDLGAASRALVRLPQAWSPPLSKVRDPIDYVLALGRALGVGGGEAQAMLAAMASLGQRAWTAPQPNGWPDEASEWAVAEGLLHRIEWANVMAARFARRGGGGADPRALAQETLGPLASADTLREAARAGSPQDAFTLVLVSPEFQRR
jgi:uncharacterized protein (DUF1800 family)